jgi:hypothetical protein
VLLEANGDVTGVRPRVHLERIRDPVLIEHVVQLPGIHAQSVLIANVNRDGPVAAQAGNVLIDERERRIRGPLRQDRLLAVTNRQIEVQRRILRIG